MSVYSLFCIKFNSVYQASSHAWFAEVCGSKLQVEQTKSIDHKGKTCLVLMMLYTFVLVIEVFKAIYSSVRD